MSAATVDVLIVGAGPVGLFLAELVSRHGLSCRIVDQNDGPSQHSKAIAVHARTLEIFEAVDALDRLLPLGLRMKAANLWDGAQHLAHVPFSEIDSPHPYVLTVPQSDTEAVLCGLLAGRDLAVERGTRLASFTQDDEEVTATFNRDGGPDKTIVARFLIGTDGAHSTVRKGIGAAFEGEPYAETFALADVSVDWDLPHDELSAFLSEQGAVGVFPLPGARRVRLVMDRGQDSPHSEAEGPPGPLPPPRLDEVQAMLAARTGRSAEITDVRWLASFRVHRRIASVYRVGRVFLAGDAAHIHSPVGGQGMNTGLQDAWNLAWKLALVHRGEAHPALLDSYQAERRPIALHTLSGTDVATKVVTLKNPIARGLRDRLIEHLSALEAVQERVMRSAAQLGLNYRKSPIVGEHRASLLSSLRATWPGVQIGEAPTVNDWRDFGGAARPGDRAPDAIYDGQHRLFPHLRGIHHTLLLFDGAAATAEGYRNLETIAARASQRFGQRIRPLIVVPRTRPPGELHWDGPVLPDGDSQLHQRYGARSECLYLIRPDGYVAFRSQPADGDALEAYLTTLFR